MRTKLDSETLALFKQTLQNQLEIHYRNHWFPESPDRGSGYRCIRINNQVMDPVLNSAAFESGLNNCNLLKLFPEELTLWIDPSEVSYRIGENGSVGQLDISGYQSPQRITSPRPSVNTNTYIPASYPMKTHSSCKDQIRGLGSRIGYPVYAAFAS